MPEDKTTFKRHEDFVSLYANNVNFELSVWDLKLIFGQLDQSRPEFSIEQHTAITLPWPQAKIGVYYMLLNLMIHQSRNGAINIPASVLPPRPDPNDPAAEPSYKPALEYLAWIHDQFFSSQPYVPPAVQAANDALASESNPPE